MGTKREPADVWRGLVNEADADERAFEEAASASVKDTEKALAEAGVDVKAERERGAALRRELEARVAARKAKALAAPAPAPRPHASRRPPRTVPATVAWIAVLAAAAAGGTGVYLANLPRVVTGIGTGTGGGTVSTPYHPPPPPPQQSDLAEAAQRRRDAVTACNESRWNDCLADLDVARSLDPDGDDAPAVKETRQRAIAGILGGKKPPLGPK